MYKVEWKDEALESLAEIGLVGKKIKSRIETHLVKNPTGLGKPLKGSFKELWETRPLRKPSGDISMKQRLRIIRVS